MHEQSKTTEFPGDSKKAPAIIKRKKCHDSQHLGGAAFAVYVVLLRIVRGRKMSEVSISSRRLAKLTVYDKNKVAMALNALVAAGWLDRYRPDRRFKAPTYGVNSHEEWAELHPGGCESIVPILGTAAPRKANEQERTMLGRYRGRAGFGPVRSD